MLTWKPCTIAKTLPTAKKIELINKRKFVKVVLDENANNFIVHVDALRAPESAISIYFL